MATLTNPVPWRPKLRGKYVAYLRTSARPHSKLNIEAQRKAIRQLVSGRRAKVIGCFEETEPLVEGERPELERAIEACKASNADLIFGKLDRMRSAVRWLERLHEEGIAYVAADIVEPGREHFWKLYNERLTWRLQMSDRVRDALAKAKAEGKVLGGNRGNLEDLKLGPVASAKARRAKAYYRDARIMSEIDLIRHRGVTSLPGIATRLNQMGLTAPRGGPWSAAQVRSVVKKFDSEG